MDVDTGSEHRTPGQLIQELLDANGWTQSVLAVGRGFRVAKTVRGALADCAKAYLRGIAPV
jgi:hypothetical protein